MTSHENKGLESRFLNEMTVLKTVRNLKEPSCEQATGARFAKAPTMFRASKAIFN